MRFLFLLFFLLFIKFNAFSQSSIGNSFESQNSPKVVKLAARLTGKLNSDEEKVIAIHEWITHHIKYDVKKYLSNDYTRLSTSSIIRKKKATCVGYSDLFTELCSHSNLECVNVSGYIKDHYTDLGDKIYLDEHMWNAVKVNGQWKMVDACWDAGYVKNLKMSFSGTLQYLATFGKKTNYKYKPHFVKDPGNFYFLRSGTFFSTDHLAVTPLWQLISPSQTKEEFENDSSFFIGEYESSADSLSEDNSLNEKRSYAFMDEKSKYISDGFLGHKFNERNNFQLANSYRVLASDSLNEALKKPAHSESQTLRLNMIIAALDSATFHYTLNDTMLMRQERELLLKNDFKKNIFDSTHKQLASSTKTVITSTKNNKAFFKHCKNESFESIRVNDRKIKGYEREKPIEETKSAKRTSENDSVFLSDQVNILTEIAAGLYDSLKYFYKYMDEFYPNCKTLIYSHYGTKPGIIDDAGMLYRLRVNFNDDLDYKIILFRDSFILKKLKCDSLLLVGDTSIFKYMSIQTNIMKDQLNHLFSIYQSKLVKLRKLKTKCKSGEMIDVEYDKSVGELIQILSEFKDREAEWISVCDEMTSISKKIFKQAQHEMEAYDNENKIEKINRDMRISHIKNRRAGYQKLNKQANSANNSIKSKANKALRKVK